VRRDIATRLGLRKHAEVIASFDRPNLRLSVERAADEGRKRAAVVDRVAALAAVQRSRPGLVYTASRKDTELYAGQLEQLGLRVAAYHAGMRSADRKAVHDGFLGDAFDVVVATSAFGMGIDKPDVRFVVHASAPASLDSYYQQIGRAGRDGQPADITLFYRPEDLHLQGFLTASHAPEDVLKSVAEALRGRQGPVRAAQVGAVRSGEDGRLEYSDPGLDPGLAVEEAVRLAETHQTLIRSRIEMIRGYAETTGCWRQFLLGYFGEDLRHPCGNCDTCPDGSARDHPSGAKAASPFATNSHVRHRAWGHGVVMSTEQDRLTVLFDEAGYKTLDPAAVESHHLLEHGRSS